MKKLFITLTQLFQHHIEFRYVLTPVASTIWLLDGLKVRMIYVFGVRVYRGTI